MDIYISLRMVDAATSSAYGSPSVAVSVVETTSHYGRPPGLARFELQKEDAR